VKEASSTKFSSTSL